MMKRFSYITVGALVGLTLLGGSIGSYAKTPPKIKQLVYGVNLYQGKGFSGTFVPKIEKNVSIVADRGNVISPKVSMVYYWPITGEYMADWETMNQDVGGKLEILDKDDKVIETLDKVDIGFDYPNGPYDDVATLIIGDKANTEFTKYEKSVDDFYEAQSKYYQDQQAYEEQIMTLLERAQAGQKTDPKNIPKAPKEPIAPSTYITKPFKAFVVDLPVGDYKMRLVQSGGEVVKDSEKNLRVVEPRRSSVGYEVSPETKWPTSVKADQPQNVIYYNGNKSVFLNPYWSEELPLYDYMKITQLHKPSSNNAPKDAWSWVFGDPIKEAKVEVVRDDKVVGSFIEQPFYIEQSGTDTARRNFVVYKKENYSKEQPPHLTAYRVKIEKAPKQFIRLVDAKGEVIEGSERELRAIKPGDPRELLYVSIAPLLFGLALMLIRRSRTSKGRVSA